MGKRELLIIVIFACVAIVAYQLTAPAAPEGEGLSFSRFFGHIRREMKGNPAVATHVHRGTVPVSSELQEIRVQTGRARVKLTGESRKDISYEMAVESTGPDPATALQYAQRVAVKTDDLGASLTLSVHYPDEATQTGTLVVLVPSRLAVRLLGGVPVIENVASVQIEGVSGDVGVTKIAGALTGTHRNGRLTADGIGSVNLAMANSRAKLANVRGDITINARTAECAVEASRGKLIVDATQVELSIAAHDGPVRVSGSMGQVRVDGTRSEVNIDMRRTEVEVTVSEAHPMTLITTDEPLRVYLSERAGVTLDALASGGKIQATEFGLTPESSEREARLTHTFGDGRTPRIALRNTRGDIVIRMRK